MSAITCPLVVDLDGTLIFTDMLHESALRVFRDHPWDIVRIPFWLARGKAELKRRLAARVCLDPQSLPYHADLVDWLKIQRSQGRRLVLCTASDESFAHSVAAHLGFFDEVMASDGSLNLAGKHKADALEQRFGLAGFDYVGNSIADFTVWQRARRGIVVNRSADFIDRAERCCKVEQVFQPPSVGFGHIRKTLRLHQWLKNLLLFVPVLAAHRLADINVWPILFLAFIAFSLCASAVYIANDLLDLESDRLHPRKRNRPFASGSIPVAVGAVAAPVLLAISGMLAWRVGGAFLPWLAFYFLLTCAYSWGLKRYVLVDCLVLAMLYTLRIIAGAAAVGMDLSFWLLAFSVFLFLSLAFVKRYAELQAQLLSGVEKAHGRGYYVSDAPLVQTLGVVSGYASVLVLALYLNSEAVLKLYRTPEAVWGAVLVMLFWVSWIWLQAHRGRMHDDPLVFAVGDGASLLAGSVFAAILIIGSVGWSW